MKPNEIMIGDWVRRRYITKPSGQEVVRDFRVDQIRRLFKDDEPDVWGDNGNMGTAEQMQPIPLTPEILEKNGWEERRVYDPYMYYLLTGKDYSVSLSKEWDSTTKTYYWSLSIGNHRTDASLSVDYVHQLQHALRLCGIEKEVVL